MRTYISLIGYCIFINLTVAQNDCPRTFGNYNCALQYMQNANEERLESQCVLVKSKLYVIGGFTHNLKILNSIESYNFQTNTWINEGRMPTAVTHAATVLVDDDIWIIGGFIGNHPGEATNFVQIYNTQTAKWRPGPVLPHKRASLSGSVNGSKIHILGGLLPDRNTDVGEHYVYDIKNPEFGWLKLKDMPNPRNHHSAVTIGDYLYVIGGQYGHDLCTQDQKFLHRYNTLTDSWERLTDLPQNRSHFEPGTIVYGNKLIIIGGRDGDIFFDEITMYDTVTNCWLEVCNLPAKLLAPAAKIINNYLIVTNGGVNGTQNPSKKTYAIPVEQLINNLR